MGNLTIAVDDEVLRRARIRAAENGTSVNEVLRHELARYAASDQGEAVERLLALSSLVPVTGKLKGGDFKRDEAYEGRLDRWS